MKIIQQRDKLLSNFEVYEHLCSVQSENNWAFTIPQSKTKNKRKFNPQLLDLEIITRDLSQYLTKMNHNNESEINRKKLIDLMIELNNFELEVIEKLMIINSLPRSLVNLYAIIEECEDRFDQNQCEFILECVAKHFPPPEIEDQQSDENVKDIEMDDIEEHKDEDDEDDEAFVQDDELEHEVFGKKKNDEKEIDEVDA